MWDSRHGFPMLPWCECTMVGTERAVLVWGCQPERRRPAGWRCVGWRWPGAWRGRRWAAAAVAGGCWRPGWRRGACAAAWGSASASGLLGCPGLRGDRVTESVRWDEIVGSSHPVRTVLHTLVMMLRTLHHFTLPWIISLILLQIPAAKSLILRIR